MTTYTRKRKAAPEANPDENSVPSEDSLVSDAAAKSSNQTVTTVTTSLPDQSQRFGCRVNRVVPVASTLHGFVMEDEQAARCTRTVATKKRKKKAWRQISKPVEKDREEEPGQKSGGEGGNESVENVWEPYHRLTPDQAGDWLNSVVELLFTAPHLIAVSE